MSEQNTVKIKKCPSCNREFQFDYVVCPHDRTMLLVPQKELDPATDVGRIHRWLREPYEVSYQSCSKCGQKDTRNFLGRCKKDWGRFVLKRKAGEPVNPPVVRDRFQFIDYLGETALCQMFSVQDLETKERLMFNLMNHVTCHDAKTLNKFTEGIEKSQELDHPSIIKIFYVDFLLNATDLTVPYFVSEPMDEFNLLLCPVDGERKLAIDDVIAIFKKVVEAFEYAHQKGVFHGYFSLEKIGVREDKENGWDVRVFDFGIAERLLQGVDWQGEQSITRTESLFGDPYGLAPEQIRVGKKPNAQTDIYSLGCALYEALCGRRPIYREGNLVLTLIAHMKEDPDPFKPEDGIVDPINEIVFKCLAKDPNDRYKDASQLLSALKSLESS